MRGKRRIILFRPLGQGAKQAGAAQIVAIDMNPDKFDLARHFGATDVINPKDIKDPVCIFDRGASSSNLSIDSSYKTISLRNSTVDLITRSSVLAMLK